MSDSIYPVDDDFGVDLGTPDDTIDVMPTQARQPLRILWCGDAAVSTGFARCSHTILDALHLRGDRVMALGINYFGDPHPHPYPIFPCRQPVDGGYDSFGVTRLPVLVNRYRPEVVVLLNDPWNIPAYVKQLKDDIHLSTPMPKLVGWIAVDGGNQHGDQLNGLDLVIVWTEYARQELIAGGCTVPIELAPLGVDSEVFYPREREGSRLQVLPPGVPDDAFIIGVVGRDQPRKRLDLSLRAFAHYVDEYDDDDRAYLYLHVAPTGESGTDIKSLIKYYGLQNRVIGTTNLAIGTGVPDDFMATLYSSFDLYLSTSQGEGWGLPALEAMACGTPCLLPKWAAYTDWAAPAANLVKCKHTALTAPLNNKAYTIGGVVDHTEVANRIEWLRTHPRELDLMRGRGIEVAERLSWSNTAATFLAAFDKYIIPS